MRTNKIFKSFFLFFICFMFSANVFSQKLHFILIVYPDAEVGVYKDKTNMTTFINDVCTQTGLTLNKIEKDNTITVSQFTSLITGLSATDKDVIFVYYTGHGKNYDTWPYIKPGGELPLTTVYNTLSGTNARLTISMFDCCTYSAAQFDPPARNKPKITFTSQLFLNYKGDIKVASASSEEFSYGSANAGGIFTNAFLDAISGENSTWEQVLTETKSTTKTAATNLGKTQTPQYVITVTALSASEGGSHNFAILEDYPYNVKSGDTFESIATSQIAYIKENFDKTVTITASMIKNWNSITSLTVGKNITIKASEFVD